MTCLRMYMWGRTVWIGPGVRRVQCELALIPVATVAAAGG